MLQNKTSQAVIKISTLGGQGKKKTGGKPTGLTGAPNKVANSSAVENKAW